jgi:hypothetical protein
MRQIVKVLCAAVWYDDGVIRIFQPTNITRGIVITGHRHHNCYQLLSEICPSRDYLKHDRQGFITSDFRFVNRQEAARLAFASQQIPSWKEGMELHSEDLY